MFSGNPTFLHIFLHFNHIPPVFLYLFTKNVPPFSHKGSFFLPRVRQRDKRENLSKLERKEIIESALECGKVMLRTLDDILTIAKNKHNVELAHFPFLCNRFFTIRCQRNEYSNRRIGRSRKKHQTCL